jgi:pimeloyl-ACP methyl ester carboxylesterase
MTKSSGNRLIEKRQWAGGCRFNYLEGGADKRDGLPLVFLHGWGLAAYAFRDGLELLARRRRIVAPDLPGFHRSLCSTAGWGYPDYACAVWALTQALGLSRFHLAGHSTGGGIAVALAADYPTSVASLTLIDSAGVPLGSAWKFVAGKLVEQPAQAWATGLARQHLPLLTSFVYNALFCAANARHAARLPLHLDVRPQMARVRAPCQVVWGENDRAIPVALGRELAAALPGASLEILPGAYHEWSALRPDWLVQVLENFIRPLG